MEHEKLNGYCAFYNQKKADIYALNLWDAKQKAVAHFKAPKNKAHLVSVMLAEKNGAQVVHIPA